MAGDGGRQDAAGPWACVGAGAWLATAGLRRRSWRGLALALAGGGLAYYGLRRVCRMPGAHCEETVQLILDMIGAGVNAGTFDSVAQAAKEERHPAATYIQDEVRAAEEDSF